jgi:hypothetical protein
MIQKVRKFIPLRKIMTMKHRFLRNVILFTVLLAGCAPDTSTVSPVQPEAKSTAMNPPSNQSVVPTETLAPTVIPVATSRGPELHATDPVTVRLASGGLQLVEFFRFT